MLMESICKKTRRGSPVDRRPSTAEAPPIGKIHPFSKMAVTFEQGLDHYDIVYFIIWRSISNRLGVAAP